MGFKKPGFVTGVRQEAKLVPPTFPVLCSGANALTAYEAAKSLIADGCDLLVSFGLAGGLDPALKAGALLLPQTVLTKDGNRFECQRIEIPGANVQPIFGSDELLATVKDKADLFARTQACAVDMESHAVARAAAEAHKPFLVLRAVADTAGMALPAYVGTATRTDGSTDLGAIILGLAKNPTSLPELIRLAACSGLAFKTLKTALPLLLNK